MGTPSSYATKQRDDARIAAIRPPVRGVERGRHNGPRRSAVTLADVVRMPGHVEQVVPTDAATVQSNHRVVLRACFEQLGWGPDTPLSFTVGDGAVLLTHDDEQPVIHVRTRHQITLPVAVRHALGVEASDSVVAVADVTTGTVRLLGPAALADAERFSRQPRAVRDSLNQLAPALTTRRLAVVLRLLTRIGDEHLEALAALPQEQLDALLTPDAAQMRS